MRSYERSFSFTHEPAEIPSHSDSESCYLCRLPAGKLDFAECQGPSRQVISPESRSSSIQLRRKGSGMGLPLRPLHQPAKITRIPERDGMGFFADLSAWSKTLGEEPGGPPA